MSISAAGAATLAVPSFAKPRSAAPREIRIVAAPGSAPLLGLSSPRVAVWSYDGQVPGREIRIRQGERLRVLVENRLREETTVHWHGVRVPNGMDGVPHLTQIPITPGKSFTYEFDALDAGTYWYHPHQRGYEQVGRGLYGPLIVEEAQPLPVDRDIIWMLGDWRMLDGGISDDFGSPFDIMHAGRVGNTVTINGGKPSPLAVRSGERIRLRLINAANARIFGLNFEGLRPQIIAWDGQPVAPHEPSGSVVLGPAMRVDLILDMIGKPGAHQIVTDDFYKGLEYPLTSLVYSKQALRDRPPSSSIELPRNRLAEPDVANALRHEVVFSGGMNGGIANMDAMMEKGMAWMVNGVSALGHVHDPLMSIPLGRTALLALNNNTAWWHPIHLHGHSFRVLSRNGRPTKYREWQDTILIPPHETAEVAFVADNPGDWMFHCHVLEHQAGGMMATIRVA